MRFINAEVHEAKVNKFWRWVGRVLVNRIALPALAALFCSCATIGPLPKVNLQEPGWTVRQGQGVWHLAHGEREIAGDLIVATAPEDRSFVQFSKTPFPLAVAQSEGTRWSVEFPPQNKHYAGRGKPPQRVIWFYLTRALSGKTLPPNWTWQQDAGQWQLTNQATGESIEGYFNQ